MAAEGTGGHDDPQFERIPMRAQLSSLLLGGGEVRDPEPGAGCCV